MQGFAGFVLNRIRIIRQTLHMAAKAFVILLQLLCLGLQIAQVMALILVCREAIFSENNVVPHHDGQQRSSARGQATAIAVEGIAYAPDMGRESAKLGRFGRSFHLFQ